VRLVIDEQNNRCWFNEEDLFHRSNGLEELNLERMRRLYCLRIELF